MEDNWLRGSFDVSSIDAGSWFLKEITKLKYIQVKVPLNHKIDKIPLRLVCPSLRFWILYIMAGTSWRNSWRHSSWRHRNCCYIHIRSLVLGHIPSHGFHVKWKISGAVWWNFREFTWNMLFRDFVSSTTCTASKSIYWHCCMEGFLQWGCDGRVQYCAIYNNSAWCVFCNANPGYKNPR